MMPGKQDMRTPKWLVYFLAERFTDDINGFELDAAATRENSVAPIWYGHPDGLTTPWYPYTFCNPPFKRFGEWADKAIEEAEKGNTIVLIGPVGCSQSWFHRIMGSGWFTCYCPDKRINFLLPDGTPTKSADRDTMIFVSDGYQHPPWRIEPLRLER